MDKIIIKGARENNLKNIDLEIPKNKLVVFTGLSGSGKSSLAFDTIYAEGQRRYVESLSSYARQFLGIMKKPDIDLIEGLSPAISIDQKSASHNPRSTVGTVTEIYDYLRLLYARIGHPHCPNCNREISRMTKEQITNSVFELLDSKVSKNLKILILAPIVKDRKGEYTELFVDLKKRGYKKVRIDNQIFKLDEEFILIKTNKHTVEAIIDQVVLTKDTDRNRIASDVEQGLKLGSGELIISIINDKGFDMPDKPKLMTDEFFSEKFACPVCNIFLPEIEPRIFSFNTPHGACATCSGLGNILTVDQDLIFNDNLTVSEGGLMPYQNLLTHETWASRTFKVFCAENNIPISKRLSEYTKEQKELLLNGTGEKLYYVEGANRWGKETAIEEPYKGILEDLKEKYQSAESTFLKSQIEKYMRFETCPSCMGARLKKEALGVTINNKSIVQLSDMSVDKAYAFMNDLDSISAREKEIGKLILKEIKQRLTFLVDVGLDYLTLSRGAQTLAGGEAQRIRLASQIGSGLTGVLYVLDEPSIGLHQRDNQKLIDTLKKLRDLGNTVLVVEHDEETMQQADYIVDFGPGAGEQGGHIVAQGTYEQIIKNPKSLTGEYLSLKRRIKIDRDEKEADSTKVLRIEGATEHNLKNISVDFPLNKLVVITGVSGSGKSTLVNDILYHALMQKNNPYHRQKPGKYTNINGFQNIKNIFMIDQSPIGRTPRSNPATYIGAFNYIRDLFAKTKDAKIKGYGPGRFSFNVKGGRCEACEGEGRIKIEMQFLPDVYITCEVCDGQQYNHEALEVEYNGKNISQVLRMSAQEALTFFSFVPGLSHKLQTLNDVGLGYLKLGQPAPTLSGGEAQRVKLAAELSKRGSNALYLLDEPTTGLHFADLEKLLHVLRKLVDLGNTVIVIEHNLDVIKNADHIIDLGPEGGEKGGQLVVTGTPEEVAKNKDSYTGKFLKRRLEM